MHTKDILRRALSSVKVHGGGQGGFLKEVNFELRPGQQQGTSHAKTQGH